MLIIKGSSLLVEAYSLEPEQYWPWLAVAFGPLIGSFKGKYIFRKSCQRTWTGYLPLTNQRSGNFLSHGSLPYWRL